MTAARDWERRGWLAVRRQPPNFEASSSTARTRSCRSAVGAPRRTVQRARDARQRGSSRTCRRCGRIRAPHRTAACRWLPRRGRRDEPVRAQLARLANLTLEVGELPLEVRIDVEPRCCAPRSRRSPPPPHDLGVCILDLLEAPCRLERATVVIWMVELRQPAIGRANLLVGRSGRDPEDLIWIASAGRHLGESVVHELVRFGRTVPARPIACAGTTS